MRITLKAAAASLAAFMVMPAAPALAAPAPALVAPGAPMRIFPQDVPKTVTNMWGQTITAPPAAFAATCSQGPAGTVRYADGTTRRVMLTAAHCVNTQPGGRPVSPVVTVPQGRDYVRVGVRERSNQPPAAALNLSDPMLAIKTADWGTVLIDDSVRTTNLSQSRNLAGGNQGAPVQLTTIKDYRTLRPGEIAVDNFGQPICKDGSTSGRSCGTQLGRTRNGVYSWGLNYQYGDSGGVNYDPRDGSVIGVTSIVLGPLGKAQPADRIVEEAYGVPDGQVNNAFKISAPEAPRAQFPTGNQETAHVNEYVEKHNPDFKPIDPTEEFRKAADAAQQDAQRVAEQALKGQFNPAEAQRKVAHHTEKLSYWGGAAAAYEVAKRLP